MGKPLSAVIKDPLRFHLARSRQHLCDLELLHNRSDCTGTIMPLGFYSSLFASKGAGVIMQPTYLPLLCFNNILAKFRKCSAKYIDLRQLPRISCNKTIPLIILGNTVNVAPPNSDCNFSDTLLSQNPDISPKLGPISRNSVEFEEER